MALLSSIGTYSKDRIRYEFGLPNNLARAVAAGLSIGVSEDGMIALVRGLPLGNIVSRL